MEKRAPSVALFAMLFFAGTAWAAPPLLSICHGYSCKRTADVVLTENQWHAVQAIFGQRAGSPDQERQLIARGIAMLESLTLEQTGLPPDLGGNVRASAGPGQMDCIDESSNTTTYLRALESAGLLRWHSVQERRTRRKWIFDEHWAAVIRDLTTQRDYAVDSWFFDNGQAPVVNPIEEWLSKRGDPE